LLQFDSNINFQKYLPILDANLWIFVAEDFMHWHTADKSSRYLKTNKKLLRKHMASPVFGLNCAEHVCLAIKLKLYMETDVIKT